MLTSNGSPVKRRKDNSPNKKSVIEEMLPIVNRKWFKQASIVYLLYKNILMETNGEY